MAIVSEISWEDYLDGKPLPTNGHHTNGPTAPQPGPTGHTTDEAIDSLYSWFPGMQPTTQPLPEAAFSLTLKGTLDGVEALFTVRGQTAGEFQRNLAAVRGLLDRPAPKAPQDAPPSDDTPQCPQHGPLTRSTKHTGWYCPHKTTDGQWCKSRSQGA